MIYGWWRRKGSAERRERNQLPEASRAPVKDSPQGLKPGVFLAVGGRAERTTEEDPKTASSRAKARSDVNKRR
jgi:hypothetical protein